MTLGKVEVPHTNNNWVRVLKYLILNVIRHQNNISQSDFLIRLLIKKKNKYLKTVLQYSTWVNVLNCIPSVIDIICVDTIP